MNSIEVIICLVLLFMAVPDVCRKLGRPALTFSAFVTFGLLLSPLVSSDVRTMLDQAGEVGFLLLLFQVGLEIDLPRFRELLRPFRFAMIWSLVQYPLIIALAYLAGLDWVECLVAAAALTACSVGMAYPAWKNYPGLTAEPGQFILGVMIALETLAIVLLAVETTALGSGLGWFALVRLVGIVITMFLIARFAAHLQKLFETVLQRTTHWRVHFLVLSILAVCALGQRLGLDAAKTAFFMGLFMSRIQHNGVRLEDYIAPISDRFLIPVFFVALGLTVEWKFFLDPTVFLAVATCGVLLIAREITHRRWMKTGGDGRVFLLFCPNLTIVALAARAMQTHGTNPRLTAWLVLSGLFLTVVSILLTPRGTSGRPAPVAEAEPAVEASGLGSGSHRS